MVDQREEGYQQAMLEAIGEVDGLIEQVHDLESASWLRRLRDLLVFRRDHKHVGRHYG